MLVLALLSHTAPQKREYVLKLQGCVNYDGILQLKLLGKSAAKVIQYIRVFQKKHRELLTLPTSVFSSG